MLFCKSFNTAAESGDGLAWGRSWCIGGLFMMGDSRVHEVRWCLLHAFCSPSLPFDPGELCVVQLTKTCYEFYHSQPSGLSGENYHFFPQVCCLP